ncbi:MAG: VOC family protein [Pseudomonadota bacterium]|jgi:uncharacterized glyoxalase superfamily protein PhnB
MNDPFQRPTMISAVAYRDPLAALDWLDTAFGFERSMVITAPDGSLAHAEMRFGNGLIYVGAEWADFVASPAVLGGRNTQVIHVLVSGDIDSHCDRARIAGAAILQVPTDQFYGDRTYRARDLEGHVWVFGAPVRAVSREEAEAASGLKIEGWH